MPLRKPRRPQWALLLALLSAPIALVALGLWLEPDPRGYGTHEQLGLQPCFPMSQWGVPCPACGLTTAVSLASHGRLLAALRTQPLGPALLALALVAAAWALVQNGRGRDLGQELARLRPSRWGAWLGIAVGLGWILKLALTRGWGA